MKNIFLPFIFTLLVTCLYAQVPTFGLVAEYTFNDGTGSETNPNGYGPNNATLRNTTGATDRFGNGNHAQDMDGQISTHIKLGTSSVLTPVEGTISMWVWLDTISHYGHGFGYRPMILAKNNNAPGSYMEGYGLYVRASDRKLLTITTKSAPSIVEKYYFSDTIIQYDRWYHYVMTYNNDTLKSYINKKLVKSIYKGFTSTFHSGDSVMVGNSANSSNSRALDGIVDDIRIYNRVLSQAGVDSLFNESDPSPNFVYADLKKKLDGGATLLDSDTLRFKFQQQYQITSTNTNIAYNIYDWERAAPVMSGTFATIHGTNWVEIILTGIDVSEYHILEIEANKGQKYYLRFKPFEP